MNPDLDQDQAKQYRSRAENCERLARREKSLERKTELMLSAEALRALADNEDWLSGSTGKS